MPVVKKNFTSKISLTNLNKTLFYFFSSTSKFDSHCGWPAFSSSIGTSVKREKDEDGYRVEILCANCGGHLGLYRTNLYIFVLLSNVKLNR